MNSDAVAIRPERICRELTQLMPPDTLLVSEIGHSGMWTGGIPWLMMSELFPTRIRAKTVSITTTFLWGTIFSGGYIFPTLTTASVELVGSVGGAFWLFTGICLVSFLFGWRMMPETKGRTLEDIAESWKQKGMRPTD